MVYSQKLVACIKVNGQILRETDNTVSIPFGSEYTVLLKNLNSVRVQVKVHVDGTDATEGTWLIIRPNDAIELERYIRNGNLQSGNKFKFIPKTKAVEKHRGNKADDGLIRIEFKTEKVTQTQDVHITRTHYHDVWVPAPYVIPVWPGPYRRPYWWGDPYYWDGYSHTYTSTVQSGNLGGHTQNADMSSVNCFNSSSFVDSGLNAGDAGTRSLNFADSDGFTKSASSVTPTSSSGTMRSSGIGGQSAGRSLRASKSAANLFRMSEQSAIDDAGITVPGGESNQTFWHVSDFPCHAVTDVIVIKLRGQVGDVVVEKAVTVKTKKHCATCGKSNRGQNQFCAQCGTALNLI